MNFSAVRGELGPVFSRVGMILPATVLAVALFGCGSDIGSRSMLAATQPTAAGVIVDESTGGGGSGEPEAPSLGNDAGTVITAQVTTTGGAQIVCGRHTLTIPPGSLTTDAQVTLIDMTGIQGYPCVRILPEDIQFKKKATLTSVVSDLQNPQTSRMYRIHTIPHNRVVWTPAGGGVSAAGTGITASVGQAGVFATPAS